LFRISPAEGVFDRDPAVLGEFRFYDANCPLRIKRAGGYKKQGQKAHNFTSFCKFLPIFANFYDFLPIFSVPSQKTCAFGAKI
jgi:hypothetical protein